ncbi:hypothetical protein EDC94DRAFT_180893 [Helicostylum pulchrum]|nr:hypothetical protein EDC94DRAFT_180893 [Helicostylum pulchrum]
MKQTIFLYEEGIDVAHYTLQKLSNQLLQPVLQREHFSYTAFQVGALCHVYSENYGFGFEQYMHRILLKNKISDPQSTLMYNTIIPLFKKGSKISTSPTKRVFYFSSPAFFYSIGIKCFKLKTIDTLRFDKPVDIKDASEKLDGPGISGRSFKENFDAGFIISIVYEGYWSSLSFTAKYIGDENSYPTIIAEPMTLARF